MSDDFVDALVRQIEARRATAAEPVVAGHCADYPAYRYSAGRLQGLADAAAIIRGYWNQSRDQRGY